MSPFPIALGRPAFLTLLLGLFLVQTGLGQPLASLVLAEAAQPANDNITDALPLVSVSQTNTVTLAGATFEPGEVGIPSPDLTRTVWFKWTSAASGKFYPTILNSWVAQIEAFEGSSVTNLVPVPIGWYFETKANRTYYLRIAAPESIDSVIFSYWFEVTPGDPEPEAPANDNFADAIALVDAYNNRVAILSNGTLEEGEPKPHPDSQGKTIWYSWVAPVNGRAAVRSGTEGVVAGVYTGTTFADMIRLPADFLIIPGERYLIQLDILPGGTEEFSFLIYYAEDTPAPNDNFALAASDEYNSLFITQATAEPGEPIHRAGEFKSLWWSWQASYSARATFQVSSAFFTNASIAIYTGDTVGSLVPYASGENAIAVKVDGGQTYKIAVAVPVETNGHFEFRIYKQREDHFDPIPGNQVQNWSFENVAEVLAEWNSDRPSSDYIHLRGVSAHGERWITMPGENTALWQDVPTTPGRQYELAFSLRRSLATTAAIEMQVARDEEQLGEVTVAEHSGHDWRQHRYPFTAGSDLTRIRFRNLLTSADLDAISVVALDEPPSVEAGPEGLTSIAGGSARFSVLAAGSEPLRYQWFFNGNTIPGGHHPVLSLTDINAGQAGSYHVTVSNNFGAVTSSIVSLDVETYTSPVILVQPSSRTAPAGTYVALSVLAAGAPPLAWQWYHNGAGVPHGTNADLVIPQLTMDEIGSYEVVVSSSAGTVTSLAATLNVTTLPPIAGQPLHINGAYYDGVYDADDITGVGSAFVCQIYAGETELALYPVGEPIPFRDGEMMGAVPGPFNYVVPFLQHGSAPVIQVRAWERAKGATFEHARAAGGKFGTSELMSVDYGDLTRTRMHHFSLRAGLPRFTTGRIQPAERLPDRLLRWSFEGLPGFRYLVERSSGNFDWEPFAVLANHIGIVYFVTDAHESGTEFYRARIVD